MESEEQIEHIKSNIIISESNMCRGCAYSVYAKSSDTVTFGTGNIYGDFIFVLPAYDFKTKVGYNTLLTYLRECYRNITGKDVLEDVYVTRLVKCNYYSEHNLYESAVNTCYKYLNNEFARIKINNIIFFGSAYDDYIGANNTNHRFGPNRIVNKVISPGIIYYGGDSARKDFEDNLRVAINTNYY